MTSSVRRPPHDSTSASGFALAAAWASTPSLCRISGVPPPSGTRSKPEPLRRQHFEPVLGEENLQPLGDDVRVRRRDGDALRVDVLQAVDEAVALRRGRQSRQLRDVIRQLLVERRTFIEGDRRAEHRDQVGALGGQLLRARHRARNGFVVALDRHAVEAEAVADEADAARIETARVGRNAGSWRAGRSGPPSARRPRAPANRVPSGTKRPNRPG